MSILSRSYAYSKVNKEDPDEIKHRQAQFLIYKVLEQADSKKRSSSSSCLRVRIFKLKIKVGKRLKKLRKTMLFTISTTKSGIYKQVLGQMKTWKRLFQGGQVVSSLPIAFK